MNRPKINPSEIPAPMMRALSVSVIEAVQRFYADPKAEREFQIWKKKREQLAS